MVTYVTHSDNCKDPVNRWYEVDMYIHWVHYALRERQEGKAGRKGKEGVV